MKLKSSRRFDQSIRPDGRAVREVQASEAKTHLPQLLDAVERGETIVITRHGRAIARIVPEAEHRQTEIRVAIDGIKALRCAGVRLSTEEIGALLDEGRNSDAVRA